MDKPLAPGDVIAGKLRVIRELGAGGMGTVYEVEHELTRHRRALKVLHERAAQDPAVVGRFLREASAAARIGNAHIAETFDAGRLDSGAPYLLMELLEGDTLDALLKQRGAIDAGELADLVIQACDGVQAAHDAGIVHRDLKPENLFVTTRDGAAFTKVLDFGISKFESARDPLSATREGVVIGTPYYMPPEQVRGEASIDARADVYALGVILYECACGARPFEAQSVEHLAVLIHQGRPTPLAERNPALSTEFCATVHKAMATERAERFPSARALADALAVFRTRASAPSAKPRIIIMPSSPPPAGPNLVTTSAGTAAEVSVRAFADTMASDRPPPLGPAVPASAAGPSRPPQAPTATSRRGAVAAAGVVLGVALLAGVGWLARSGAPAAAPPAASALPAQDRAQEHAAAPPPATLAPLPSAAPADPAPSSSASPLASAAPSASHGHAPPPHAEGAPSARSRTDQTGLANENPFR